MPTVAVEVSSIISHPTAAVWKAVSYFGDTFNYQIPKPNSRQRVCGQDAVNGAKALRRFVYIGKGRLCEELVLVDNDRYEMEWRLASEGGEMIQPFPASLCGYRWVLRLEHVTVRNRTFVKVQATFKTENEMAGIMHAQWQQAFESMLESLEERLREVAAEPLNRPETREVAAEPLKHPDTPEVGAYALKGRTMSAPDLRQDRFPPPSTTTMQRSLRQAGSPVVQQCSRPLPPPALQHFPSGKRVVPSQPPMVPSLSLASWRGRSVPQLLSSATKAELSEPTQVSDNPGNGLAGQSPQMSINATSVLDLPSLRYLSSLGHLDS